MNKTNSFKIIYIILLFQFKTSFAQTKGIINYKYIVQTPVGVNDLSKIIYFDDSKSMEYFLPKNVSSTSEKISETEYKEVKVLKSSRKSFIYKNLKTNQLFLTDFITSKPILIIDTLNHFNWKITGVHLKISNYNCTKAILNFRGRDYIAWFTDEIPLQLGPWKFGGLPGLVIKVSDTENKFSYELTGIDLKTDFDKKLLEIPSEYKDEKPLSHGAFISSFNKKIEDYSKMSKVIDTYQDGSTGSSKITLAEKQEKF